MDVAQPMTVPRRQRSNAGRARSLGVHVRAKGERGRQVDRERARDPPGVRNRLHEISHAAQEAGQFGPAVRAEELLGKSIGMWIDRSLQLSGQLNDSHVTALLELARKRQAEPIDLADDQAEHDQGRSSDSE